MKLSFQSNPSSSQRLNMRGKCGTLEACQVLLTQFSEQFVFQQNFRVCHITMRAPHDFEECHAVRGLSRARYRALCPHCLCPDDVSDQKRGICAWDSENTVKT